MPITHATIPASNTTGQVGYTEWAAEHTLPTAAEVGAEASGAVATHAALTSSVHGISAFGATLVDDADAATARSTLGLGTAATTASTAYEASGAVSTHAAVTSSVHGISAFGATLVDDADASAARTTLGLGTVATKAATSGSSILKGDGSGGFSNAASGTDYAPATSGSAILKGNGSGGFSSAASGTDYAPATSGSAILKGNGSGGFSSATADTDYAKARAKNYSTANQGAGFASDTYVTGSSLLIPTGGMVAGMRFVWTITASKTAASTATPVYTVRIGANQSTADTSRLALTANNAQTAATDAGVLTVSVVVRSVSATGVIAGGCGWSARGGAAGFGGGASAASSTFDNSSLAGSYIGLSINGGTSSAWTVHSVYAELIP